ICFIIFSFTSFVVNAQVKFTASVSSSEISKDDLVQLKLMVENAKEVQQINPPNLKDFTIVSGPNQESGMSMVKGVVKKYIALSFVLKPKATGNYIIPSALAKADGTNFKSNPVSIKVTASATNSNANTGAAPFVSPFSNFDPFAEPAPPAEYKDYILKKGENPVDKINKNMFVRSEVDKNSCYVGEPVVATFKLYTRLKSESNLIKNPSFNGFSVIDLQQPNDMNFHVEKFNGREYNVYTLRKAQLYPLMPGNLDVGIAQIENNVHFIKAGYANQQGDLFNDLLKDFAGAGIPAEGMEDHKVILQNKPLSILVKPLPEQNKPVNFKGAVGKFDIITKVEKETFTTEDAGKLAIVISGQGNLQMINAPNVNWPVDIEGFDSKATDNINKNTVPVSGRKIFEFPFTVSKAGSYQLPAVEFVFFDSENATYKTVSSKPITITVTKSTGKQKNIVTNDNPAPENNFLTRFFNNRLRVVSVVASLIIICLIFWLKLDSRKEKKANIIKLEELNTIEKPIEEIIESQHNPLELAEEQLLKEDGKAFYMALNEGLKKYLSKKFSIAPEELDKKKIIEQVDKKGIANETAMQLYNLIDEIEFELYTPIAHTEKMKEIYERTNTVIQLLNTYHF
ncbi:MAG TPA: BatD family protein, partial [Ferruginibacter sp.]|nr:BatD family protein [Ferruginibacter sp.]